MNDKIAVVVSCFNHQDFIDDLMKSIINQIYQNFHVIFWDNCSSDNSLNIAMNYAKNQLKDKMSIYSTNALLIGKTLPIGIARFMMVNKCFSDEFDYIAIVDADDIWTENKLEKQLEIFKSNNDIKLVFSDCYYLHWEKKMIPIENYPIMYEEKDYSKILEYTFHDKYPPLMDNLFFNLLSKYNFMPCPTLMFERKALQEVIGNPMHYSAAEDYDWILKMTAKYKCSYVKEPLAYYRIHSNQLTTKTPARCTMEEIDVVKRAMDFKKLTRKENRKVRLHLIILYMKLIYKEIFYK